jgi:hypothetical protein
MGGHLGKQNGGRIGNMLIEFHDINYVLIAAKIVFLFASYDDI